MVTRVLHLRDTSRVCGPGKTILESCCRIDSTRYLLEVGLFLRPGEEAGHPYIEAARARGVTVVPIWSRRTLDWAPIRQIVSMIDEGRVHVLHAHEYKSELIAYAVRRLRRIPVVTTVHGWIRNDMRSRLVIAAAKRCMRAFDLIIAVSPAIRTELLRAGVPRGRVRLVYNGIVSENYRRQEIPAGRVRQAFGIPDNARLIGAIGRLSPEKGHAVFLEAAARIACKWPCAHFVLFGEGPCEADLRESARAHQIEDRVTFAGYWDDIRPGIRDLELLALPSYTEGFPNVLLEALSMGVPVVASDVGGVHAIVTNDQTGYLVEPGNAAALANRMADLLAYPDRGEMFVRRAGEMIANQFSFDQRIRRIEGLYDELFSERDSSGRVPMSRAG